MTEKNEKMNILLCFDDKDGNYTRHAAVTILSLLETNKKNQIKIYIMTSSLSQENVNELKSIVKKYNQEIEFIITNDIIPKELKNVIINRRENMGGPRYRYFFQNFIKGVDRVLYMDCDVLVMKDVSDIYNMNMHGKAIAGYYDIWPYGEWHRKDFKLDNYINTGVLLFDAKQYDVKKINVENMEEINGKYGKYFRGRDQDKINIIFKNDIFIARKGMNYQIRSRWFNKGLNDAALVHCLEKPYREQSLMPSKLVHTYYHYLDLTKRKGYPATKSNHGRLYIISEMYSFCFTLFWIIVGKISGKYHH